MLILDKNNSSGKSKNLGMCFSVIKRLRWRVTNVIIKVLLYINSNIFIHCILLARSPVLHSKRLLLLLYHKESQRQIFKMCTLQSMPILIGLNFMPSIVMVGYSRHGFIRKYEIMFFYCYY